MAALGGEELIAFVSAEYEAHAQEVYMQLDSPVMNGQSMWDIFERMLPLM